mmetsp:Transcript_104633/g.180347  ORF Transcript_104633/g.180347 Transcript_104633/m.180347 type:complete len:111 (-) Transcript_104633:1125-1457(-)
MFRTFGHVSIFALLEIVYHPHLRICPELIVKRMAGPATNILEILSVSRTNSSVAHAGSHVSVTMSNKWSPTEGDFCALLSSSFIRVTGNHMGRLHSRLANVTLVLCDGTL